MEMNYLNWEYWYEMKFKNFKWDQRLERDIEAPEENPDFFMIIHPEMKKNFKQFGDICYITIIDDGIIRK